MIYPTTEILWDILLQLRSLLKKNTLFTSPIIIYLNKECNAIQLNETLPETSGWNRIVILKNKPDTFHPNAIYYLLDEDYLPTQIHNTIFDKQALDFFSTYLPFCFIHFRAAILGRCISTLHFAQTLDGKIATKSGDSKWIGNHENLIHAHRMRALCDAILIGTNTLNCDKPALTVRYVNGTNPTKIVIGSSITNFHNLLQNNGKVIYFTKSLNGDVAGVEYIRVWDNATEISPTTVLHELYKRNIQSLYIEGGSKTASAFLREKSIDNLQLFLSPQIFGSGISNFELPEISKIADSIGFSRSTFQTMGDGMLFTGEVIK